MFWLICITLNTNCQSRKFYLSRLQESNLCLRFTKALFYHLTKAALLCQVYHSKIQKSTHKKGFPVTRSLTQVHQPFLLPPVSVTLFGMTHSMPGLSLSCLPGRVAARNGPPASCAQTATLP